MPNNEARKRAQAKYDAKRPPAVLVRLTFEQLKRLDELRMGGEGRGAALARLAGFKKQSST